MMMDKTTADQRRVIESSSPWIAVQAQPGSGKTHVLVERLVHLLSQGGKGDLVAITFTEKAAEEIKARVEKAIGSGFRRNDAGRLQNNTGRLLSKLWISTIHGFCLRILKEYSWVSGFPTSFSILSEEEELFFQQRAILHIWESEACLNLLSFYEPNQCQSILEQVFKLPAPFLYDSLQIVFKDVFSKYEEFKKEHRSLDFDDLLILCLNLLRQERQVRKELRRRFSDILVDEFQDTDEIQKEIIDLLTEPDEERSPHPSLMIVGDLNQSIYRFRGANVDLFRDFKEEIVSRGGFSFDLVQNFRSTKKVIDFVNTLFEPLLGEDYLRSVPADADSGKFPAEIPRAVGSRDDLAVEYWTYSGKQSDEKTDEDAETRRRREATWLATYVHSFQREGSVAILLRGMTYSHFYEEALTAAGVPWVKSSSMGFYEEPEVEVMLSLLKWVCHPEDDYSLWVIRSSPWGVSSQLEKMKSLKSKLSLMTWYLKFDFPMTAAAVHFLEEIYQFEKKYPEMGWEDFLIYMEILRGRDSRLRGNDKKGGNDKGGGNDRETELREEGVRILTVHQAKGLEFDSVFLPDLGYFPRGETPWLLVDKKMGIGLKGDAVYQQIQEVGKRAELEESKRIFYVAATRAKRRLILSQSSQKPRKGSWGYWMEEGKERLKPYMEERQFE